jgi:hypothetical protein
MAVSGSTVYVGGEFSTVGGVARSKLAGIGTDGTVTAWNPQIDTPDANSSVSALAVSSGTLLIGGSFGTVDGASRNRLAAFNPDGSLSSWAPDPGSGFPEAIAASGSTVYLGGDFATINGRARNNLAPSPQRLPWLLGPRSQ